LTGLAWWTKYNGWLPLAVGLAGGTAWQLFRPRSDRQFLTLCKRWLLVAACAFLIWSPVLIGLQKHGGYAAVAANHRQYVGGLNGWGPAALRQLEHAGLYDNWWGVPFERGVGDIQNGNVSPLPFYATLHPILLKTLVLVAPIIVALVAVAGCLVWIAISRATPADGSGWLLFAWIGGLTVATPFYHPYPRLILPWLMTVWLGVGLAIQLLVNTGRLGTRSFDSARAWQASWCEACLAIWLVIFTAVRCQMGTEHCWQDRSDLARKMEAIATQIKKVTSAAGFPEDEAIAYVYGEPAIVFALKSSGLPMVGPVQNLNFMAGPHQRPTFFLRTSRVYQIEGFHDQWEAHQHSLEPIAQKQFRQSHLVQLDSIRKSRDEEIQVFRVR
jgi:hypothetical protein